MKMHFSFFLISIVFLFVAGCQSPDSQIPSNSTIANNTECGVCPIFSPPSPAYCSDGVLVPRIDGCGCQMPPGCNRSQAGNQNASETHSCSESNLENGAEACTDLSAPVCGWFDESIKCFAYPCAQTFSNSCEACRNAKVSRWTDGECPKVGGGN